MNEQTKQYQINCFLSPLLEQPKTEEIVQKIKQWIAEKEGSVTEENWPVNPVKKNLAYQIDKFQEAFYFGLNFILPPQYIEPLCKNLNLEKNILRYLITAIKQEKAKSIKKEPLNLDMVDKIEPLPLRKSPLTESKKSFIDEFISKKAPVEKKEKVKLEELDKKLEEILNQ